MSLFYFLFFFVVGYLLFSIFKKRDFLKFVFSIFGMMYQKNKTSINDAIFLYEVQKSEELSAEEIFTLGLGDLEHERLSNELEEIDIYKHLEHEWGLSFEAEKSKEHTVYVLQQIWAKGTLSLVFQNLYLEEKVSISDMVAFDSVRFTELLRQVIHLKFLEKEEAWGLLFLNAQRVQDSYANWAEFRDAYFRGLTLYLFSKLEEEEQKNFDFQQELMSHKENSEVKVLWIEQKIFSHFEKSKN
jgi:hypothetical protein